MLRNILVVPVTLKLANEMIQVLLRFMQVSITFTRHAINQTENVRSAFGYCMAASK